MLYRIDKETLQKHPHLDDILMTLTIEKEIEMVEDVPAQSVLRSSKRRVRIVFPYDLRTDQAIKSLDCIKSESWTAFVNSRQTLVHVMRFGHPSLLIRLPKLDMKNKSEKEMSRIIQNLLYETF